MTITPQVNSAIVLYNALGTAKSPQSDKEAVVQQYGHHILSEVVQLMEELDSIHIDWSDTDLVGAGQIVRREMHARHPELSDAALDAIFWRFTFNWR